LFFFFADPMPPRDLLLALAALMMAKESELFAAAFSPANALLRLGRPGCGQTMLPSALLDAGRPCFRQLSLKQTMLPSALLERM
jgi:hypothetical protein